MQEPYIDELQQRASDSAIDKIFPKKDAAASIKSVIDQMLAEDKILALTAEEEEMLREFRRFKAKTKHNGDTFRWQTRLPSERAAPQEMVSLRSEV